MSKLYIAYGSNLNLAQMASRCPTAEVYGAGILNNWELVYRGSMDNSHATIIRRKGAIVPVLVWKIQPWDELRLDVYEGYPKYYYKQTVTVDLGSEKKRAMVYIMDSRRKPGRPSRYYIETIRQGYLDNGLDMDIFEESLVRNSSELQ